LFFAPSTDIHPAAAEDSLVVVVGKAVRVDHILAAAPHTRAAAHTPAAAADRILAVAAHTLVVVARILVAAAAAADHSLVGLVLRSQAVGRTLAEAAAVRTA